MKAIANESGVSRQWMYEFFPDVESILHALFVEVQTNYFETLEAAEPRTPDFQTSIAERVSRFLDMPVTFAMLTSYALNGGAHQGSAGSQLRTLIWDTFEATWIEPLVVAGFVREGVVASLLTLTNAAIGLNIAVAEGLTTRAIAEQRLLELVQAIIGLSATPLSE